MCGWGGRTESETHTHTHTAAHASSCLSQTPLPSNSHLAAFNALNHSLSPPPPPTLPHSLCAPTWSPQPAPLRPQQLLLPSSALEEPPLRKVPCRETQTHRGTGRAHGTAPSLTAAAGTGCNRQTTKTAVRRALSNRSWQSRRADRPCLRPCGNLRWLLLPTATHCGCRKRPRAPCSPGSARGCRRQTPTDA